MLEFLVNRIEKIDNIIHGIVLEDKLVIHNFGLVFGLKKTNGLLIEISQKNENCYLISRFGDYVGFLNYKVNLGFSLTLTDFENNFNNALDEYLLLQKKEWKKDDIIKYLQIAKEIETKSQPSIMTISNAI